HLIVGAALGFSAGVFLCISLGDLLPELELHSHNRLKLSLALLLGVAVAWGVEQTHNHPHSQRPGSSGNVPANGLPGGFERESASP
ncbi:MAG: hypothetical protein KDA79_23170, partial [Planctomycetaceae bacterium]|nr:hypothetical protein [Planctomycetaceae bacterium]